SSAIISRTWGVSEFAVGGSGDGGGELVPGGAVPPSPPEPPHAATAISVKIPQIACRINRSLTATRTF
ncbi:MAG: hypothetical protein VYC03_03565, partial [Pseudomonadota bacterium]|nr:hypothetical protein [Pseudomonadota bacterium]